MSICTILLTIVAVYSALAYAVLAFRTFRYGEDWEEVTFHLGLCFVLAIGFLAIQGYEYASASFSWRTDVYGSLFFTILSLHGLHVIGAILIVAWLEARSFAGHFNGEHHAAVQAGALYWHFVDLVWLAIFAVLYLSPRV